MKRLVLALAAGLALWGGVAGCAAQGAAHTSSTARPGEYAPLPDGPALGVGPWSLTHETPPDTQGPALGEGAPAPQSP
jgi:hypothetical protein